MKLRCHERVSSGRVIDWAERGRTKRLRKKYRASVIVCRYEAWNHGGARILAWYGGHMRDVGHVQFRWWKVRVRIIGLNNGKDVDIEDGTKQDVLSLIRNHVRDWKQAPGVFMSSSWSLPVFSMEDYEYYSVWNALRFHVGETLE